MFHKLSGMVLGLAFISSAHAAAIDYDFTQLRPGTVVDTQFAGVVFSLVGGIGAGGSPSIGHGGLSNSSDGLYPTANILKLTFSDPANHVSFTFDPADYCRCTGAAGDTYYEALDMYGAVLETGKLGASTAGNIGRFSLLASDIHTIQFNNGNVSDGNWLFALDTLQAHAAVIAAVPEPETYALLLAGLGMLGGGALRRARIRPRAA